MKISIISHPKRRVAELLQHDSWSTSGMKTLCDSSFFIYSFPQRRWTVSSDVLSPILMFWCADVPNKAGLLTFHPNSLLINLAQMFIYIIPVDRDVTEDWGAPRAGKLTIPQGPEASVGMVISKRNHRAGGQLRSGEAFPSPEDTWPKKRSISGGESTLKHAVSLPF